MTELYRDKESKLESLFGDSDFVAIQRQLSPFNLFEAVGAIRGELRHSNFLAYLLSPSRPHGLGTKALSSIIRSILMRMEAVDRPIMLLELIVGDLDDAIIYRERDNIDILLELPALNFVIAIENKVGAKAGDGQLERYSARLLAEYPNHRRLLVFLTPDATAPDHEGYVSYDYADIADTFERLISDESDSIPEETKIIIQHYIDLVRRHIVRDEKLRSLAKTLYERHKEAFDFVFENRPDPNNLLTVIRDAVNGIPGLSIDSTGPNYLRFVPQVWDDKLTKIKSDPAEWSKTGRGIMFEVKTYPNAPGRVNLSLILGPGKKETRAQVYDLAKSKPEIFTGLVKPMGAKWVTIFSKDFLTSDQAKGMNVDAQENCVSLAWSDFLGTKLMTLTEAIIEIDIKVKN